MKRVRGSAALAIGLAVSAMGCGSTSAPFPLGLEDWPSTGLYVGALLLGDGVVLDSTGLKPIQDFERTELQSDREAVEREAWALGFDEATMASLRLVPDERTLDVSVLQGAAPEDWSLPEPAWTRGGAIGHDGITQKPWANIRLTSSWCEPIEPCEVHRLQTRRIELPGGLQTEVNVVQPIDDARALVFSGRSIFEFAVPDGPAIPLTGLSTSASMVETKRVDAEIYGLSFGGRVVRMGLEPSYSLEFLPGSRGLGSKNAALAVGRTSDQVEIFISSSSGLLERFDGSAWETVVDLGRMIGTKAGGALWLGPGHVVFMDVAPPRLYIFKDGVLDSIDLPSRPRILVDDAQLGLLIGADTATIYRLDGKTLSVLPETPFILDSIHLIAPFGRGFAYAQNRALGYFDRDVGWCPPQELAGNSGRLNSLAEFPGGILWGAGRSDSEFAAVFYSEARALDRAICVRPALD